MPPTIEQYEFGKMVVDGQAHSRDLIVYPDRVQGGWWREEGHRLGLADLSEVVEARPEVLVVGQGAYGRMQVPDEVRQRIEAQGIELQIAPTREAVDLYARLTGTRRVVGAFHLTC